MTSITANYAYSHSILLGRIVNFFINAVVKPAIDTKIVGVFHEILLGLEHLINISSMEQKYFVLKSFVIS